MKAKVCGFLTVVCAFFATAGCLLYLCLRIRKRLKRIFSFWKRR